MIIGPVWTAGNADDHLDASPVGEGKGQGLRGAERQGPSEGQGQGPREGQGRGPREGQGL